MADDYGAWKGAQQATQNLPALGMGLMGMKQRGEHYQALEGVANERLMLEQNKRNFELQEAQKKEAELNKPYDITTDPRFLPLPDKAKEAALNHFTKNGFTDPNGVGTRKSAMEGMKLLEQNKDAFHSVMAPVIEDKKNAVMEAYKTLGAAKMKGDPNKIKEAEANFDNLNLEYQGAVGNFTKHISELDKRTAKEEQYSNLNAFKAEQNALNRDLRRELKGGVGGGEASIAKEAKTKISEVNNYIRKTTANRAKWLKEYEKDPNSDYGKKMAAEIENFDNQLAIAEDTLAGLQDGSVDPKTVKSGGGAKSQAQKLDEKTAASILQEAGGDKEKARAIAKQRGFTF